MKRTAIFSLGIALVMGFSACGSAKNSTEQTAETSEQISEKEMSAEASAETTGNSGNVLVVYYSASGNTAEVAGYISEATGGDLFEIQPVNDYTSDDLDWTNENSRVCLEHDDPDQRNVELVLTEVANWDSYDTVFIGYPIWWGIAAWPVDNFVKENDFDGKNIIPFCTSASSDIGNSGDLLAEMAGSGNWLDGERFQSGASKDDVTNWVDTLILN